MNDTPGWASPGSPRPEEQPSGHAGDTGRPEQDAARPAQPANEPEAPAQGTGAKWSAQQPPPGQWTAPGGTPPPGQVPPPPPGPGGWGGPPPGGGYGGPGGSGGWGTGWGAGWGGPPPAAKPGIIPLRPLGVGEILDGAVTMLRTHWRTVLGISLVVAVVTEIVVVLVQGLALDGLTGGGVLTDPDAAADEILRAVRNTLLGSGVVALVSMIGTVLATALLTAVTSRAVLGRPVTVGEVWHESRPQVLRLFGLIIVVTLIGLGIVAVGALPGVLIAVAGQTEAGIALAALGGFAAAIVAVWVAVRLSLASPALMLEKQGIKKALGRSVKLVRGSWWRIFGIQLLASAIAYLVSAVIGVPFSLFAMAFAGDGVTGLLDGTGGSLGWAYLVINGIGAVIGSTIVLPITAGVTVLLYIDQRIRREALDLELARAAGIQDYGSGPSGTGS
ncbi:glycerophosphoryl diester phosphodiesterase membrane domain-containing protein [Streptomyces thermodiastaticus]